MYKVVVGVVLAVALLVVGHAGVARADGGLTAEQTETVRLWYVYSDFYGIRAEDVVLGLRVLRREGQYRQHILGDCYTGHCFSVGPAQEHEFGVYLSTPYMLEYGLDGRYIPEVNIAAMAWAFNHGMQSHWRPDEHDAHWWDPVPPDPRPAK